MSKATRMVVGAAAMAAGLAFASSATAQSRCGASYIVEPGDTLYRISQQCRVPLARIVDLNPDIDNINRIEVGQDIRLTARAGDGRDRERDRDRRAGDTYRIERGDTLASIAQALGVSLIELINANEDINPFRLIVGDVIDIPGDDMGATVRVRPRSGPAGSIVTVRARNLRPRDFVTIGVGRQASEWRAIRSVRVAADGEVAAEVRVPQWARPGADLIFVVDTDRGFTYKSGVFNVTARQDDRDRDGIALEGRVRQGVECYTLRTPDGDLWSIVSDDIPFTAGEYVEVRGNRVDVSICQQGIGTVEVTSIEEVNP
ncbi:MULTISPECIES: LysM peptidoglycan-binding domain-containing protein [unclassified Roseitalea]|uniref:LysM peptidoglycan-binding domain-containing protein n=1 Tax=unclassified Roseitalea TaxID=2639107 RepID=UPI00273CFDE4|nr:MULTISPECIES: LysM peptidoglycan-binding domain-containing protein [unclassified Roseitalea]